MDKENITMSENDHCQSKSYCELLEFIFLFRNISDSTQVSDSPSPIKYLF